MSFRSGVSRIGPIWREWGAAIFARAMDDNLTQIKDFVTRFGHSNVKFLDLGCGDGTNLLIYAPADATLVAVEAEVELAQRATNNGIDTIISDLEARLPFPDQSFDIITSNQVIEHLSDTDHFVSECFRLLRPGGMALISTENLASWHNIGALLLGWQAFSLTNVSKHVHAVGNPLGNLRVCDSKPTSGMQHRRIFAYRGLKELMEAHGFTNITVRGAGYYPFPTELAHSDPRHAAFILAVATRPVRD